MILETVRRLVIGTWALTVLPLFSVQAVATSGPGTQSKAAFLGLDPNYPSHFVYDGKPFFFIGKSAFSLIDADWKAFIDEAERDGFTALRIWLCRPSITIKHGEDRFRRNQSAGDMWAFGGTPRDPDVSSFNEDHFRRLDAILDYMKTKGMVAQLTLFKERRSIPGLDFWPEGPLVWDKAKQRYVNFVVDRYRNQPNIYFEIANEYYKEEQQDFVETVGDYLWEINKTHLIAASAGDAVRFAHKPWYRVHHVHPTRGNNWWIRVYSEGILPDRANFSGPIINDEPMGSIAPDDKEEGYVGRDGTVAHHRINFWMTSMAGGYVTFHSHKGLNALVGYSPGQEAVRPYRQFFENTRFWQLRPDQSLVGSGDAYALSSESEIVVYMPKGGKATLDLSRHAGSRTACWYDPRDGRHGGMFTIRGGSEQDFAAPDNNDWVLYIRK